MLNLLTFLHDTAQNVVVRCLCLELLCDLSRLQMRLFKSQQSFMEYSNQLVSGLDDIAKFLRFESNDDYSHVLCYFTNINKCLTMLSMSKMHQNVTKEWLLNILDFGKSQLLMRSVVSPTLLKPLFLFLEGFERAMNTSKSLADMVK